MLSFLFPTNPQPPHFGFLFLCYIFFKKTFFCNGESFVDFYWEIFEALVLFCGGDDWGVCGKGVGEREREGMR